MCLESLRVIFILDGKTVPFFSRGSCSCSVLRVLEKVLMRENITQKGARVTTFQLHGFLQTEHIWGPGVGPTARISFLPLLLSIRQHSHYPAVERQRLVLPVLLFMQMGPYSVFCLKSGFPARLMRVRLTCTDMWSISRVIPAAPSSVVSRDNTVVHFTPCGTC